MQVASLDTPLTKPAPPRIAATILRHRQLLGAVLTAALTLLALLALKRALATLSWREVSLAFAALPGWRLCAAIVLTAGSYVALTFYDWFAVRTIGRAMGWPTTAFASFTSYTLSHNLGFSVVTGGSARLRAYRRVGLDLSDVARVTLLASINFWGGILLIVAVALLWVQPGMVAGVRIDPGMRQGIAALLIALLSIPFAARAAGRGELRVGRLSMPIPPVGTMVAQLIVSAIDLACAAAALFILVPGLPVAAFPSFLVAYALGLIAGLVTHVPGGIGVFETVILASIPAPAEQLFAALLIYRLVYYLAPLCISILLLLATSRDGAGAAVARAARLPLRVLRAFAPTLSAALVFAGGLVLLLSGALPTLTPRVQALRGLLPLPFVEASHFFASLAGTALLLVAPSLHARQRTGFLVARALLLSGAVFSLLKGIDAEEATLLFLLAGFLQFASPSFYRTSGLGSARAQPWWLLAAASGLALSAWVGLMAYRHVPYDADLWWDFAWRGDAPRFMRATLGGSILLAAVAIWRLLSAPPQPARVMPLDPHVAARAFAGAQRSDAMLALTGDKSFLVAEQADAFLMYRVHGRSCIVMGDPVGERQRWPELLWRMREECDRTGRRLSVYQASAAMLPLAVELGLHAWKYGEEAIVDLRDGFSLEGGRRKSLRHSVRRAEAAGLRFAIVPRAEIDRILPELRLISDAWLGAKRKPEKRFSLGRFDPDYLRHFDCAVLMLDGQIVAFANIWQTENKAELSVDLMRHAPGAAYGAMDLLFVRLMEYGAAQGFERFNLGLAPLSGLSNRRLAPLWSRAGATLFEHGERFYGFSGLRAFKEKFAPIWIPRYIAGPAGVAGWRALADVSALVRG